MKGGRHSIEVKVQLADTFHIELTRVPKRDSVEDSSKKREISGFAEWS